MALSDIQTLVADLVRDDAGKLADPERDRSIASALARYSQDRPRQVIEDVASAGTNYLPLPTGWADGDSAVGSVEYPIGEWPPSVVSPELYGVVATPDGDEIRLAGMIPDAAAVRVSYSAPHTADTVPERHHEAVASYAAALLMDQMASLHSSDTDSTIQADSVEHRSQAQEYAARARVYRNRYSEILGVDPKRLRPAGAVVNLNMADSQGRDRLTHPGRLR